MSIISSFKSHKIKRSSEVNQRSALSDALIASEIRYRRLFESAKAYTKAFAINKAGLSDIHNDKKEAQVSNLKILIVENDKTSTLLLSIAIKKIAREVLKVTNGLDAVNTCRDNPDIDLILMDIKMPVMNGYEAAIEIRKFNRKVIIIAQTAYALPGDRETAIASGCNDYISKPIQIDVLKGLIQKYFNR